MRRATVTRDYLVVTLGLVAMRAEDPEAKSLAAAAIVHPEPATFRQLLDMGRGKPWRDSVVEALAEVGIETVSNFIGGCDGR
ncbi:MAG: hypothetical protein GX970_07660 [Phyllobacteriaceae bacterium]|nr:hypothetical protein [Phyllobacteriaceae bacterium]